MSTRNKILIVEDDRDLLSGLSVRLQAEGFQTSVAPDAGAVVGAAVLGEPDLVLLDLGLPDGDGMAVLNRLQGIVSTAQIPVIVITARDDSFEERALEDGAFAFLQKPVDNDELVATISMALETPTQVSG